MSLLLRNTIILVTIMAATVARGLDVPPGGRQLTGPAPFACYGDSEVAKVESLEYGIKRLRIIRGGEEKTFAVQCAASCVNGGLRPGEVALAVVRARAPEGGHGRVVAKLQLAGAPYTAAAGSIVLDLSPEWKEYPALFHISAGIPEGKAALILACGGKNQTVEVSDIRLFLYPPGTDTSRFPRVRSTYEGREPTAPWRAQALARIERDRKQDLSLRILGSEGKPLAETTVTLSLRRHEFGFGSAVPAAMISSDSEDARRYREIVDRLFSAVVFENDLKDFGWGPEVPANRKAEHLAQLDKAFDWLGSRHFAVRGHYLLQVAEPPNLRGKDITTVRDHFLGTARERVGFAKNRVCEWDVINHPVAWQGAVMLNKRQGWDNFDRVMLAEARKLTDLPLLVNEDQIFRPGHQSDGTYDYLMAFKEAGIRIDGLGNQAHMDESYLPTPQHIFETTDRFARVVPRQVITEFDVVTGDDEELAADYTRDLLIACFSHPAYSGFFFWGFWEGSHWKPECASWKRDWTIRKRGEVLEEWLGRRWRTVVTVRTDADGIARWRGFPGWYEASGDAIPARQDIRVTLTKRRTELRLPR